MRTKEEVQALLKQICYMDLPPTKNGEFDDRKASISAAVVDTLAWVLGDEISPLEMLKDN